MYIYICIIIRYPNIRIFIIIYIYIYIYIYIFCRYPSWIIQLYHFIPISTPVYSQLIACTTTIKYWFLSINILLTPSNIALLNIHTNSPEFRKGPSFYLYNIFISNSKTVFNLCVVFDNDLYFSRYIANISKATNYNLFRIKCIRNHINLHICAVLINSLIMYRIDYGYFLN